MSIYKNLFSLVVLISLLPGCSWFGDEQSEAAVNNSNAAMDTSQTAPTKWYCYGVAEDRSWDCVDVPETAKISTVVPSPAGSPREDATFQPAIIAPQPDPFTPVVTRTNTLLDESPQFYAVQLIAMRNRDSVVSYAGSHGIDDPIVVTITSQDNDWHVLLLGVYPDRTEAESARDEWERTRVLKVKPWVRRLGPLQEAMRVAQARG